MKHFNRAGGMRSLLTVSTLALLANGAAYASNTLTEAGTSVSNTFTLDYEVGTVSQPTITNASTADPNDVEQGSPTLFTVDRKVDHSITATNTILSSPPGTTATLTYELENEGNDDQSYSFSLDQTGGTFDATGLTITVYVDANDDDDFTNDGAGVVLTQTTIGDPAGSADITADVPKGVGVLIEVSGTIASTVADTSTEEIILIAEARDPATWGIEGASGSTGEVTLSSSGSTNTIEGVAQNVLADDTGVVGTETDADGLYAATGTIRVDSPNLSAVKALTAIREDNIDCATAVAVANAKAIPGSCIEYTITVTNNGALADATGIDLEDILPAAVTFVDASHSGFSGTPTLIEPTTAGERDCDGSTTCIVRLEDGELSSSDVGVLTIRAEVR